MSELGISSYRTDYQIDPGLIAFSDDAATVVKEN